MAEQDQSRIKVIQNFAARVGSANDKKNETVTALSNIFQDLEKAGLSKKGFKFVMGLRKMEQADRNFLMREINDYSAALGLFDQGDMFLDGMDEAESAPNPTAPAADKVEIKVAEPVKAAEKAAAPKAASKAKADDFESGSPREAGKRAGLADKGRDQNPNPTGSVDAQQWDAGWTEGHQELIDKAALANGANSRPRRQRGALTEEGNVAPPPVAASGVPAAELVH